MREDYGGTMPNDTIAAERLHIAFFGMRNSGKSSLVNAVTGQKLSLVSDVKGTTTDPVSKTMELLPLGPVVIIDTPGIDDEGDLGEMRVQRALQTLSKTDVAILVTDASIGIRKPDNDLIELFKAKKIPYIIAMNKSDLLDMPKERPDPNAANNEHDEKAVFVSALNGVGVNELKERIAAIMGTAGSERRLVADLIKAGDVIVLVVPIDESAPKGRLILAQQQTIRDILEAGAISVVTREKELERTLSALKKPPAMVITDSQVFEEVAKIVPREIRLTSFSILFARYKGDLQTVVRGAAQLDRLKDGDKVLISEACTHHRQCKDIGTVKLPGWILSYTGRKIEFEFTSGGEFPSELSKYALIVHCGACMLNEREMQSRQHSAVEQGIPITNYGIAIAQMHGILRRSIEPFPNILEAMDEV